MRSVALARFGRPPVGAVAVRSPSVRTVFWLNMLSPHLAPVIRALARRPDARVTVVAETECTANRRSLGWRVPDLSGVEVVISPTSRQIDSLASTQGVHIVGGVHGYELGRFALRALLDASAHFGLMSECFESDGLLGPIRRLRSVHERWAFGDRLDFILAIGAQAQSWYENCGYPANKIFPFGYFPEAPDSVPEDPRHTAPTVFELMYLGRCAPGKGLENLARALHGINDLQFRCTFLARPGLSNLIQKLGLTGHTRMLPSASWPAAMAELGKVDLLVLPSDRKDGWGAVVNEALMLGVPVLCSRICGAAALLSESWRGELVDARSVEELCSAIGRAVARGTVTGPARRRIRQWARCLAGDRVAEYISKVLACVYGHAPRPLPPWADTTHSCDTRPPRGSTAGEMAVPG